MSTPQHTSLIKASLPQPQQQIIVNLATNGLATEEAIMCCHVMHLASTATRYTLQSRNNFPKLQKKFCTVDTAAKITKLL